MTNVGAHQVLLDLPTPEVSRVVRDDGVYGVKAILWLETNPNDSNRQTTSLLHNLYVSNRKEQNKCNSFHELQEELTRKRLPGRTAVS